MYKVSESGNRFPYGDNLELYSRCPFIQAWKEKKEGRDTRRKERGRGGKNEGAKKGKKEDNV